MLNFEPTPFLILILHRRRLHCITKTVRILTRCSISFTLNSISYRK